MDVLFPLRVTKAAGAGSNTRVPLYYICNLLLPPPSHYFTPAIYYAMLLMLLLVLVLLVSIAEDFESTAYAISVLLLPLLPMLSLVPSLLH